jgi:hypothetical protein
MWHPFSGSDSGSGTVTKMVALQKQISQNAKYQITNAIMQMQSVLVVHCRETSEHAMILLNF